MSTALLASIDTRKLKSKELADTIMRLKNMSRGGYATYRPNEKTLARLLRKIMELSKKEEEWYLYFDALYNIIFLYCRNDNARMVVKYAELFYKECALYMDEILPAYHDTDLAKLNVWTYSLIFSTYCDYHQIKDTKMDIFMQQFEDAVSKYGAAYDYYRAEMELAALYRDKELAEHGRKGFERYEAELKSCYVCGHKQYFSYYLLMDKKQKAEELMLDFLHRNIPKNALWCYDYCENAEAVLLYKRMLNDCLLLGKAEYFCYFFQKYWMTMPRKVPRRQEWAIIACLCAIAGNFEDLDADLRSVEKNLEEQESMSTVRNMENFLCWWCYFTLLDRSGVHEVEINIPELTSDEKKENGENRQGGEAPAKLSCLAIAKYFEKLADDYGMKFAKARSKFDYQSVKETYRECAGL